MIPLKLVKNPGDKKKKKKCSAVPKLFKCKKNAALIQVQLLHANKKHTTQQFVTKEANVQFFSGFFLYV